MLYLTESGEDYLQHLENVMDPEEENLDWLILHMIDADGSVDNILSNIPSELQAQTRARTRSLYEAQYIESEEVSEPSSLEELS